MPKLSIITINLNNLGGLQKTMESVFAQTFTDYEYIIIDGGSTDGSREYIEQHADKLAYWVSEKDRGMYDGMNKGISKSKATFLMFLNSGDYLTENDMFDKCFQYMDSKDSDIFYGNMMIEVDSQWVSKKHPKELTFHYLISNTINHQATYIKRSIFCEIGFYNVNYRVAADHLFFLQALIYGFGFCHINRDIVFFDTTGTTSLNWKEYASEMNTISENEIPGLLKKFNSENQAFKKLHRKRIFRIAKVIDKRYVSFRRLFYRKS